MVNIEEKVPCCFENNEKEWLEIKKQFENDFTRYNQHIKSFDTIIGEILKDEKRSRFVEKTHLSENMFYRIKHCVDKKDPPKRNTLMSVAVGYNLDLPLTEALLDSLGLSFILSNPRDYAYQFLLTRCRGKSIDECNEILKCLGIEEKYWLGIYARK